jgi:hypothetical protein
LSVTFIVIQQTSCITLLTSNGVHWLAFFYSILMVRPSLFEWLS